MAVIPGLAYSGIGTAFWIALSTLYFAIGTFTVSSYGLFMDLTDRELGSTQFSTFMAATNLCESWAGYSAGILVASHGYSTAFGWMALATVAALPLLSATRNAGKETPV